MEQNLWDGQLGGSYDPPTPPGYGPAFWIRPWDECLYKPNIGNQRVKWRLAEMVTSVVTDSHRPALSPHDSTTLCRPQVLLPLHSTQLVEPAGTARVPWVSRPWLTTSRPPQPPTQLSTSFRGRPRRSCLVKTPTPQRVYRIGGRVQKAGV